MAKETKKTDAEPTLSTPKAYLKAKKAEAAKAKARAKKDV